MKLLPENDFNPSSKLYIPEGTVIEETLLHIIKYKRLNQVYTQFHDKDPILLITSVLEELDLQYDIPDEDLKNIPDKGGFITISNHPYRGIDSMLLLKIILEKRKDFKILSNILLQNIEPMQSVIIPVKTTDGKDRNKTSFSGIKEGINHLKNDHGLGIFPAGDDPQQYEISKIILDREWQTSAFKFIKNAEVPVIPVYFHGTNSRLLYIIRKINPLFRLANLPSEIINRKNKIVKIRIGSPLTVKEQSGFKDNSQYGRYLRARTYLLGSSLEPSKFFVKRPSAKKAFAEPIATQVPATLMEEEFRKIRADYELFTTKNYSVICAPTFTIPEIFNEIGRLRELTFREIGEGTNKSSDIDEYDLYYNHLFIWDTDRKKLVGAYRIGKGKDVANIYGINGFYINSLFRIKKQFLPVLRESLELGRSFIVRDYQKKAMPLFLLWKGIMMFLLKNQEYRYLIGPVSISNEFSKFSKSLIVEFIMTYFFDWDKARFIAPRKEFVVKRDKLVDQDAFIDAAEHDINKIEKILMNIEPGYRMPVLLKKYLEINGRIIGFNIDPKFNGCLDGLLILDLYNTPPDFIKGLSRELNDESILRRFKLNQDKIMF